jgi:hypothetical protein
MRQASTRCIGFRQRAGTTGGGAEQVSLAVADAGRHDVGVEVGFQIVMRRHLVALAYAREGGGHHRDQRAVAQADECRRINAVEKFARLFAGQHRRLAGLDVV